MSFVFFKMHVQISFFHWKAVCDRARVQPLKLFPEWASCPIQEIPLFKVRLEKLEEHLVCSVT